MIKKGSTLFLKAVLVVMALIALAIAIFALPSIYKGGSAEFPMASKALLAIITILYVAAVPFFITLWQTWKLLNYIDTNKAFSDMSVRVLRNIKRCATIISILGMATVPLLLPIADADDAPGLLVIGFAFACAPIVVAVFAAVLEKLLTNAIEMKSENELTV